VTPVLLDSGVIVALLDRSEKYHATCIKTLEAMRRPLVTCEAVITESCYLLRKLHGAPEAVLANVESGSFQIPFQLPEAASEIRALMHKYRDLPVDFADACLIYLAGALETGAILTLDRHFLSYRWRRNRSFEMLIDI
jgi:predicted nucleic acid-binding protein